MNTQFPFSNPFFRKCSAIWLSLQNRFSLSIWNECSLLSCVPRQLNWCYIDTDMFVVDTTALTTIANQSWRDTRHQLGSTPRRGSCYGFVNARPSHRLLPPFCVAATQRVMPAGRAHLLLLRVEVGLGDAPRVRLGRLALLLPQPPAADERLKLLLTAISEINTRVTTAASGRTGTSGRHWVRILSDPHVKMCTWVYLLTTAIKFYVIPLYLSADGFLPMSGRTVIVE